jgi:3-oxoacyl-[acyl-carrier-protein] synthase-3
MEALCMQIQIVGTGAALPEQVLTNHDLATMVETSDQWILSRTGIRRRRIAGEGVATSDLACSAAAKALAAAGISAADLELIIVATATPDYPFPSTACLLQERLGAKRAAAFDLAAACSGFVYALAVAGRYLAAGEGYALVVGADTLSKLVDYQDRSTCILFGDGAGAVVLGQGEGPAGIISTYLGADGSGGPLLCVPAGGSRLPVSAQTIEARQHYIRMNGQEIYKFAIRVIPECISRVLEQAGLSLDEVDHLLLHQANLRIIQAVAKKMGIAPAKLLVNIEDYGNMSAASIPVLLAEAVEDQRIRDGQLLLMVGFGAGLTMGSALVLWGRDER